MRNKNLEDFYPLSPMQQGMLFHSLYAPGSGVYVEQLGCTLRGALDIPAFERAWQRVLDRHPILRTAFVGEGLKEPVQVVHRNVQLLIERLDWRALAPAEQQKRLRAYLQTERERGFDLSQPPLMRLTLMQIAEDAYNFVWSYHHILLDGWSNPILLQEVFAFYEAFHRGRELTLRSRRPYRDYIVWLKKQDMEEAETFWRKQMKGFTAPTPLTVDRPLEQVADQEEAYDEQDIWLSPAMTRALQSLSREHYLTLNTLVQGAWALLLSRYSGENDIAFGATVSGRPPDLPESEFMIGLFINTLPVRITVAPEASAADWLRELQAQLVDMRQYEYSSLVQIQGWSDVPRSSPLFESILVFENYPVDTESLQEQKGHLRIDNLDSLEQTNYPLTVVAGVADALMLKIVYDVRRFDDATISRMLGHLEMLLEGFAANPNRPISTLPLLTETERRRMLIEWNDNPVDYPRERCAHELFEEQAQQTPEAIAVTLEDKALTYKELDRRANQLAHYLQKAGVGPETIVGICVDPSLEMIIGMLGVQKAGGAYLPLDPTYPENRLAFMLEDSQAPVLLTQGYLMDHVSGLAPQASCTICLDTDWSLIAQEPDKAPESPVTPDNLAYVIYTSGSTGRPKGTMLHHRGLCNLVYALGPTFEINTESRLLQFASFSFDASVADIFPALLCGATLCLAPRETIASSSDLLQLLRNEEITITTMVPSALTPLPAEDSLSLQTLIAAGERCSKRLAARWAPCCRFFNCYGPTEATVAATYYLVEAMEEISNVPIGYPICNTKIHLLDQNLQAVPIGVPGELHIGGVSLARGYLDRPSLTAAKFIPDPYADEPGARLYKTGDLARYRADGAIEFLGRIDHQVKVRGFRIELGEVEVVLSQHPGVQQAVALAREDRPGDKRLVAYVVPSDKQDTTSLIRELRKAVNEKLPNYMHPSAFVTLDAFPLTPNKKVDRKALPAPDGTRQEMETPLVGPRDALELEITRIWEEILGIEPVGVEDDFFALGGHSLLAIRLIAQMEKRFGISLPMVELFQQPTVAHLASVLRRIEGGVTTDTLVPIQPEGPKRPLFFVHPSGGSVHWYADLGRHLRPDQPFYGIQARGLNGDHKLQTSIESMAAHYVAAIRDFQPEGPYLLGSWSMGVAVAFEMAQQFHSQGQEVAFLGMLDQGPYLPAEEPEDDAAYLVDVFGEHLSLSLDHLRISLSLDHLRTLDGDEQTAHVWEEARKVNWIYPEVTLAQFRHFVHILRTHTEAWRSYEPQEYPGQITLFRARKRDNDHTQELDMGWGELALGGVEIHQVPGDHLSMMHRPRARVLARKLKARLDEIESAA